MSRNTANYESIDHWLCWRTPCQQSILCRSWEPHCWLKSQAATAGPHLLRSWPSQTTSCVAAACIRLRVTGAGAAQSHTAAGHCQGGQPPKPVALLIHLVAGQCSAGAAAAVRPCCRRPCSALVRHQVPVERAAREGEAEPPGLLGCLSSSRVTTTAVWAGC